MSLSESLLRHTLSRAGESEPAPELLDRINHAIARAERRRRLVAAVVVIGTLLATVVVLVVLIAIRP